MKDLDFDELDRAVNSLMTKNDSKPTVTALTDTVAQAEPSTDTSQSRLPSTATPDVDDSLISEDNTMTTPSKTIAPRRSGRFMDMMPASATTVLTPARKFTSRQGVSLSPMNDIVAASAVKKSPEVSENSENTSSSVDEVSTPSHSWPDPIDLHEAQNPVPEAESIAELPVIATEAEVTSEPATPIPENDSPFILDAKVEKRPLGGNEMSSVSSADEPVNLVANTDTQSTPQIMPAELGEDLLAIEAGSSATSPDTTPASAAPASTSLPAESPVTEEPSSMATQQPQSVPQQPGASSSISQQYKVAQSTRDQSHAALYDTAAEPLKHPAKQSSSWPIIIVIILLIVLGAGGAAALYFLKLI